MTPLTNALALTLGVWTTLLVGWIAVPWIGIEGATLASFVASTILVWGTRNGPSTGTLGRRLGALALEGALGVSAGVSLQPALASLAGVLGGALGPMAPAVSRPSFHEAPGLWLAAIILAPAFEERLYRDRLLLPVRERFGAVWSVLTTSALFSIPHLASSGGIAPFACGLFLATFRLLGASLALCIALHAGLNLGALLPGEPPGLLAPLLSGALGAAALGLALWSRDACQAQALASRDLSGISKGTAAAVSLSLVLLAMYGLIPGWPPKPSEFAQSTTPLAPTYSELASWAALPDKPDAADLVPQTADVPRTGALADTFFVHPTTLFDDRAWNQALNDEKTNRTVDGVVLANQATIFNLCCRVFSPRYRQASLRAFLGTNPDAASARELAYEDIRSAFEFFLAFQNAGRPIVLAGHSQGAFHVLRLLEDYFVGRSLRERLVVAYVVGVPVFNGDLARELPDIPVCARPEQTRCIVSWNTVDGSTEVQRLETLARTLRPHADRSDASDRLACVNPLSWTTDANLPPAGLDLGGVAFVRGFEQLAVPIPHVAEARCSHGLLRLRLAVPSEFRRAKSWVGDYHIADYALFYMNVRANAQERAMALAAALRRSTQASRQTPPTPLATQAN